VKNQNFWSKSNILLPRQVFKATGKKYKFICDICKHEFEIRLDHVECENKWCPYCSHQQLCNDDKCLFCFNNSFASCNKSKYWSNKNIETPRQIPITSNKKYIFKCDICNHEFSKVISDVSSGHWCGFCGHKKLCNDENCLFCFNKSFASCKMHKCWSNKNSKIPRQVFKMSHDIYIFNCDCCNNEFKSRIAHVSSGHWCPYCKHKTEAKLYDVLIKLYPNIKRQYKVEWCKNINYLPYDFCLEDKKIIIELDGAQHFEQISNWQTPEETQENDFYKQQCCNNNGFTMIRLLQEDVLNDKYDWLTTLTEKIKTIENNKCFICNEYLCLHDEYEEYKEWYMEEVLSNLFI
jgi:very-short-patch-repair endonuclease